MAEIADYTLSEQPTEPHRFRVGEDIFEACAVLPSAGRKMLRREIASFFDDEGNFIDPGKAEDLADAFGRFLDLILLPDSAALLAERLKDVVRPITDQQVANIVLGLIVHYGQRPTPPSLPSSNGRPIDTTSSMAGPPPEA